MSRIQMITCIWILNTYLLGIQIVPLHSFFSKFKINVFHLIIKVLLNRDWINYHTMSYHIIKEIARYTLSSFMISMKHTYKTVILWHSYVRKQNNLKFEHNKITSRLNLMNWCPGIRFKGAGNIWRKEGDTALSFSVQDITLVVAPAAVLFIQDILQRYFYRPEKISSIF